MLNEKPDPRDSAGVRVPPPLIHIAALVIGALLQSRWPFPGRFEDGLRWFGFVSIVLGFATLTLSMREFRRSRTSLRPDRPTMLIIERGPYRLSRNPIYVSFALLQAGVGLAVAAPWIVLMTVPAVTIIHWYVILREEAYLLRRFGDTYLSYKSRVRRWL